MGFSIRDERAAGGFQSCLRNNRVASARRCADVFTLPDLDVNAGLSPLVRGSFRHNRPPPRCLSWLRWCGFELFKVLKSLVSLVVRLPRVASADLCAQQRSGEMQPPVPPRQRNVQRCEPARKVLRCLPAAVLRPSPLSLWLSHCVSLHSPSSLPISLSHTPPPLSLSLSLSRTDGD